MNLDNVKALQIDGHTVASLSVGGVVVWRATHPRFAQNGSTVTVYRPKRYTQDGAIVSIDPRIVWIDPVQDGTVLTVQQMYSAEKNDDVLEVS